MFGATHSIQFINNVLIFSTLFEITLLFSESTDEELEGMLARKHEWESVSKKAANRFIYFCYITCFVDVVIHLLPQQLGTVTEILIPIIIFMQKIFCQNTEVQDSLLIDFLSVIVKIKMPPPLNI